MAGSFVKIVGLNTTMLWVNTEHPLLAICIKLMVKSKLNVSKFYKSVKKLEDAQDGMRLWRDPVTAWETRDGWRWKELFKQAETVP